NVIAVVQTCEAPVSLLRFRSPCLHVDFSARLTGNLRGAIVARRGAKPRNRRNQHDVTNSQRLELLDARSNPFGFVIGNGADRENHSDRGFSTEADRASWIHRLPPFAALLPFAAVPPFVAVPPFAAVPFAGALPFAGVLPFARVLAF